jgi:hypothetical protein
VVGVEAIGGAGCGLTSNTWKSRRPTRGSRSPAGSRATHPGSDGLSKNEIFLARVIIEEGTPEHFFVSPEHERTRQFLSKIL